MKNLLLLHADLVYNNFATSNESLHAGNESSKFITPNVQLGNSELETSQQIWRMRLYSAINWLSKFTNLINTFDHYKHPMKNHIPQYFTQAEDHLQALVITCDCYRQDWTANCYSKLCQHTNLTDQYRQSPDHSN